MKRLIFLILICLIMAVGSAQAKAVFATGVSFNEYARDPGVTIMTGIQSVLDSDKDMHIRTYYSKVNWGDSVAIDNFAGMLVTYWTLPFWQNDGLKFKLGMHYQVDYATDDGDVGAAIGGELFKQIFYKAGEGGYDIGVFFGGDILYKKDLPNAYLMLTLGGVMSF